ncbi:PaaI family thioesterase [Desulfovibrio sp. OttesenSCG-928-O18]|nr:PaaI family thioesterase [Desulfovibrio sp. OttesenSCG-928-O18]
MRQLSGSPGCVICDNNGSNPRSLALKIMWDEDTRTVRIACVPDETWCGYSRIVHGGLVASVLDEAMAWVVKEVSGDWAFTADYHVRYKKALEPGREYVAIAEVEHLASRKITARARFVDPEGQVAAEADAAFLPSKGRAKPRPE